MKEIYIDAYAIMKESPVTDQLQRFFNGFGLVDGFDAFAFGV